MIPWPSDLVEDIARRKSVLFLGAGVSKNASNDQNERPKDWGEFLASANSELQNSPECTVIESCIKEKDYLTACDLIRKHLRPDAFKSVVLREFSDKRFQPAPIHTDLCRIDSRFVLTTNFDKLYETQANVIQKNSVIVKNYYDDDVADILRRRQRSVLKVHGTIDEVQKTIFTRSDYARARTKHAHFYRILESLFMTHTFVFLGASMRDPDIQMLLEDYAHRFGGTRPHFMIMPQGSSSTGILRIMEDSMNLRALEYSPSNNHAELGQSIADLLTRVEDQRATLLETQDW